MSHRTHAGQVFLYSPVFGLLFAATSLINFASFSIERADYSSLAAYLVTSVNVDSESAKKERKGLLELVQETDIFLFSAVSGAWYVEVMALSRYLLRESLWLPVILSTTCHNVCSAIPFLFHFS
ncbi:MAG: hypothetical protein WCF90_03020 [Methanomicrobiales archaeon]